MRPCSVVGNGRRTRGGNHRPAKDCSEICLFLCLVPTRREKSAQQAAAIRRFISCPPLSKFDLGLGLGLHPPSICDITLRVSCTSVTPTRRLAVDSAKRLFALERMS